MRRVLHGDVVALARVLILCPPLQRRDHCARAFNEAETGARTLRATGTPHLEFGDGSLASWAGRRVRAPEPFLDDPDYLDCLTIILGMLSKRVS